MMIKSEQFFSRHQSQPVTYIQPISDVPSGATAPIGHADGDLYFESSDSIGQRAEGYYVTGGGGARREGGYDMGNYSQQGEIPVKGERAMTSSCAWDWSSVQ